MKPVPSSSLSAAAGAVTPESPPFQASPLRILLSGGAESDWQFVRDLLHEIEATNEQAASKARFLLDWVPKGEHALRVMGRGVHDIVLISALGEDSGLELVRAAVARGVGAPLILLAAREELNVHAAALQAGAAGALPQDALDAAILERALRYAHAQQELRGAVAQNAQMRAAIDSAGVGVALLDARAGYLITYVNSAFETLTGYAAPEARGRTPQFLQGQGTNADTVRALWQSVRAGRAFEGTLWIYRKEGSAFWCAMQISPIRNPNGEVATWVIFFSDVTEKIEARNALRQSHRNLAAAQRLTHFGSWVSELDPETLQPRQILWSDEVFRIFGLEPQSVTPTRELFRSLVHPDDVEKAMSLYAETRSSASYDEQYRVLRPGGEERTVHVQAEFQRDDSGCRIVGTMLDITQRRQAEDLARQSQAQLRAVMDAVPVMIWATDQNGVFTLFEGDVPEPLKTDEAVGKSVFDLYGQEGAVADLMRHALGGGAAHTLLEVGDVVLDVTYAPTRDAQGQITGIAGVSYDITERVRVRRELDESEARFARIVANAPGMVYRFHRALSGKMRFLSVSDGCREIYGVEPEDVLRDAQILIEIVHPDELGNLFETIFESEKTLTPWEWEGRITHQSGETRWIRGQARPVRLLDDSTVWDGLVIDVTASRNAQEEILRSRSALSEAQRLARLGSFEWNFATNEVVWSEEMFRLLGRAPDSFSPDVESILPFLSPASRDAVQGQLPLALDMAQDEAMLVPIARPDGAQRTMQTLSHIETDEAARAVRLVGSIQDVTESVESQRALRESEQRYALAAQGANDGLWDWNLQNDQIYFSPRWKKMIGYADDAIGSSPDEWFSRVHPEDTGPLRATLDAHLSGQTPHFECEYRLRTAAGSFCWMLGRGLAVTGDDGAAHRIAGSQTDITARKIAEAQLSRNAFYDVLTGLPNRALFRDRLERTLSLAGRNPEYTFAVLFLDIDRFKKINDSLGHSAGDQLLVEAAARFDSCLRPGDTVARLGGDEFAILLDDIRDAAHVSDHVNEVAGRIQKELERPFALEGREVFVTVSIGVAPCRGGDQKPDELLRNADTAMYRAKSLGRARHQVFDASMHQRAVKMLEMETDLWRAIERDELLLHYQPIISLQTGQICGYEALVRWQHPTRGLVPPIEFIPLAEETGLVVPMGWWVLREACRQARRWSRQFEGETPHFMAVNLSSQQFSQTDTIERVRAIVAETGVDPHHLKLEITESVIMENSESAAAMFLQLKELGIRFSMDDFGTGYSSLSYLHRFPLDTLKIDRSFVSQMRPDAKNEIVNTILSLAGGLSLSVVAEGVETPAQLENLRAMGCGFAQGFFFSKPLEAEKIEELLLQNPTW